MITYSPPGKGLPVLRFGRLNLFWSLTAAGQTGDLGLTQSQVRNLIEYYQRQKSVFTNILGELLARWHQACCNAIFWNNTRHILYTIRGVVWLKNVYLSCISWCWVGFFMFRSSFANSSIYSYLFRSKTYLREKGRRKKDLANLHANCRPGKNSSVVMGCNYSLMLKTAEWVTSECI